MKEKIDRSRRGIGRKQSPIGILEKECCLRLYADRSLRERNRSVRKIYSVASNVWAFLSVTFSYSTERYHDIEIKRSTYPYFSKRCSTQPIPEFQASRAEACFGGHYYPMWAPKEAKSGDWSVTCHLNTIYYQKIDGKLISRCFYFRSLVRRSWNILEYLGTFFRYIGITLLL